MTMTDELTPVLKKLRLSGVLQTLDLRTKEAIDGDMSHTEFLYRLCSDEVERREHMHGQRAALLEARQARARRARPSDAQAERAVLDAVEPGHTWSPKPAQS